MNIALLGSLRRLLICGIVFAASAGTVRASFLPDGVDLWFSTSTPTLSFSKGIRLLGPGSVLSTNGDIVATNKDLLAAFEPRGSRFVPAFLMDKGLDALAVTGSSRRKTIVFSVAKPFYSEAMDRVISDGDLIDNRGQIVATHQDLLAALEPKDASKNYGLDAAFIMSLNGPGGSEIWFSTDRPFYSNALGRQISSGDVVSNRGELIASLQDLIEPFAPKGKTETLGLDTFFATFDDKGQVANFLFSTEKRFYSTALKRWVGSNDLLSSDGTIAMTQREIIRNFGLSIPICGNLELDAAVFNQPRGQERPVPEPATIALLGLGVLGLLRRPR